MSARDGGSVRAALQDSSGIQTDAEKQERRRDQQRDATFGVGGPTHGMSIGPGCNNIQTGYARLIGGTWKVSNSTREPQSSPEYSS